MAMRYMKPMGVFGGLILTIVLAGCSSPATHTAKDTSDSLAGWYKMTDRETLIPVIERDGDWFSVCRGFETPFKEVPGGLEWAFEPSSMMGTKIGFNEESKSYYIIVEDSQFANFYEDYVSGDVKPLTRIEKPKGLPDPTIRPPGSLDDFTGWYMPVYYPWFAYEIRKEGDKYILQGEYLVPDGGPEEAPRELTPLSDPMGFTGFDNRNRNQLIYNKDFKRYELFALPKDKGSPPLRMPLVRIEAPSSVDKDKLPRMEIGIPSWH